jgi:hypothetical protein
MPARQVRQLLANVLARARDILKPRTGLSHQDVRAAVRKENHRIHENKHEIVVPSRGLLSPETSVPGKYLLLDGAEQNEDETDRGELSQNPKRHAQPSRSFGDTQKDGEALAHFNTLGASLGIFEMTVAAGHNDQTNHQSE